MTRGRIPVCKCCGSLSPSAYCDGCGAHHAQRLAVAQAAVAAIWGAAGLDRWQTELRARRLATRRTSRPGRNATTERTTS